jgi:hypothetical protein
VLPVEYLTPGDRTIVPATMPGWGPIPAPPADLENGASKSMSRVPCSAWRQFCRRFVVRIRCQFGDFWAYVAANRRLWRKWGSALPLAPGGRLC